MNKLSKLLIVSVLSLFILSCGAERTREQKVSAMINRIESPFFIGSMSIQTLMDKSEIMKEGTLPFTYYQVISFFLDVNLTGIDYDTKAQFVVGEGESFLPNFYGIFKVGKEETFVKLLEVEAGAEIKEKEGMKYTVKDKEGYCVVWNEEFAVVSNIPMDLAAMLSGKGGKQGEKMIDKNIEIIKAAEEGEVNDKYVSFLEKDADLAMLYDGKGFFEYMTLMSMDDSEELEKVREIYEGMGYQIFLNFDDGKVTLELEADLDEKLIADLSFIGKSGVSDKMFKYGKSNSPLLTGSLKMELGGFLDYVKDISPDDFDGMTKDMEEKGLAIDDIKSALSGEAVYMIEEIVSTEEVYDFGYEEPITIKRDLPVFAIVLGVSDKSVIENKIVEMMTAGAQELVSTDPTQGVVAEMPKIEVMPNGVVNLGEAFLFLLDDALFMSNDSVWANKIAAGKGVKVDNPNGILTENPMGIYANLSSIAKMAGMADADAAKYLDVFTKFYGSANLQGGKFTLELKDASKNSMNIITVMIGEGLAEFERLSNPDIDAILEESVEETEDAFEKLEDDMKDVEKEIEKMIEKVQ